VKEIFPDIVSVPKPKFSFNGIPNPFWISGFVSGDSTFCVSIEQSNNKIGYRVRLIFGTCLQKRDKLLLIGMSNYFFNKNINKKSLYIYDSKLKQTSLLQIKNNSDIFNIIIPFFTKYPVLGVKSLDFSDFKLIAEFIKNKDHLSEIGFSEIIKIVKRINLRR